MKEHNKRIRLHMIRIGECVLYVNTVFVFSMNFKKIGQYESILYGDLVNQTFKVLSHDNRQDHVSHLYCVYIQYW